MEGPLQGSSTREIQTYQVEDDDPPGGPDDVVEEVDDEDAELGGEGEAEDQACDDEMMSAVCLLSTVCLLFATLAQQARHERHRRLKVQEGGGTHRQQARDHGVRDRQLIVVGYWRH